MREELFQLVLSELCGEGRPEGVEQERVDGGRTGHFLFSLTESSDGVKQISLRTSEIYNKSIESVIKSPATIWLNYYIICSMVIVGGESVRDRTHLNILWAERTPDICVQVVSGAE